MASGLRTVTRLWMASLLCVACDGAAMDSTVDAGDGSDLPLGTAAVEHGLGPCDPATRQWIQLHGGIQVIAPRAAGGFVAGCTVPRGPVLGDVLVVRWLNGAGADEVDEDYDSRSVETRLTGTPAGQPYSDNFPVRVFALDDGGALVVANTRLNAGGRFEGWLLWLDADREPIAQVKLAERIDFAEARPDGGGGSTWLDDEGDLLYLEASDHYVVRLGSNGAPQWFRSILRATDLRVATAGEDTILLLHPSGVGPMTLGLGDYASAGPALVSLDPSGDERFVVELTSGQALATSKDGTIALLSPGAPGNATLFDATGQMVWSAPLLTATAGLYGVHAAFDVTGRLVVVGTVSEPKPLPGAPDTGNLGIVSLDASGGLLSVGNVGYGAPAEALILPTAAALTPDGDLVVGGKVSGGADLGTGALTATPYSAFLVRYSP